MAMATKIDLVILTDALGTNSRSEMESIQVNDQRRFTSLGWTAVHVIVYSQYGAKFGTIISISQDQLSCGHYNKTRK